MFFFKQNTAYEMRSSDCSSDVCSSDLRTDTNMFSIHKQEAELHFLSRSEKNGTERVPAATLTLKYRTTNDVLLEFSPDLKSSFYRRPFPGEGDMADDGDTRLDDPHYLPRLKYPGMRNTIKLDHAIVGATVTLHYGIDEKSKDRKSTRLNSSH